jgi:hypothetical protein
MIAVAGPNLIEPNPESWMSSLLSTETLTMKSDDYGQTNRV